MAVELARLRDIRGERRSTSKYIVRFRDKSMPRQDCKSLHRRSRVHSCRSSILLKTTHHTTASCQRPLTTKTVHPASRSTFLAHQRPDSDFGVGVCFSADRDQRRSRDQTPVFSFCFSAEQSRSFLWSSLLRSFPARAEILVAFYVVHGLVRSS